MTACPWPVEDEALIEVRSLQGCIGAFLLVSQYSAPELTEPEGCAGLCGRVSYSFLRMLRRLGIEGVNLQLLKGEVPHVVTVSDGWAVDWTARQFDPLAEYPSVRPLADLVSEGWAVIGHQEMGGGRSGRNAGG